MGVTWTDWLVDTEACKLRDTPVERVMRSILRDGNGRVTPYILVILHAETINTRTD